MVVVVVTIIRQNTELDCNSMVSDVMGIWFNGYKFISTYLNNVLKYY